MADGKRTIAAMTAVCMLVGCKTAHQLREPEYAEVSQAIHAAWQGPAPAADVVNPVIHELAGPQPVDAYIQFALSQNPAIQAAREAARRSDCQNKLKQMGLAVQNHVNALGVFPTGGAGPNPNIANFVTAGRPNHPNKQGLGWAYQILAYLEQGAVLNVVTQAQIQSTVTPLYNCPSRRSPSATRDLRGGIQDFVVLGD